MPTHSRTLRLTLALTLLAAGVVGCGDGAPKRTSVTGTVNLDGKPVAQGSIAFVPLPGSANPSAAGEISAGEYSLTPEVGPSVGKYRIEIRWSRPTGKKIAMGSPAPPGTMVDEVKEAIPSKYNSKSTLEKEITAGENTLDFDLES